MTRHIREEPDGTRIYKGGARYKPLSPEERTYKVRKPPDAEARGMVRWKGDWLEPLPVLPADVRKMPWTRPDEEAVGHELGCLCYMCKTVDRVRRLKRERLLKRG